MRRLFAATALAIAAALTAPVALAQPDIEPAGAVVAPPDGPAQAWVLADLDTGRILASRDPYGSYAPASTIKVLLAMVVLDNLSPDAYARANQSHTTVECSCVGLTPGQPYTVTQLLAALLMVSGNDAANMLADMLGGQRVAVARMNAKAAQLGGRGTVAASPSGLDGPGWESVTSPHDLAVFFRQALKYPLIARILQTPIGRVPRQDSDRAERTAGPLPGRPRRQDRVHRPGPQDVCGCGATQRPPPGGGADVRFGRPLRSGDRAVRLGLQPVVAV